MSEPTERALHAMEQAVAGSWVTTATRDAPGGTEQIAAVPIREWHHLVFAVLDLRERAGEGET